MYLGIDIGGTKTLVACLNDQGEVMEQFKFPTPKGYDDFIHQLSLTISELNNPDFRLAVVAAPAIHIDRVHDYEASFGNLPWGKVNLQKDINKLVNCDVLLENDAKLAGLSEAVNLSGQYARVLYITISTGVGYAFINDCRIDIDAGDGGGRIIPIKRDTKIVAWEDYASGRAIVTRYGKMAKDIDDQATWQQIVTDIANGLIMLIAVFQPEIIVVGGSVGNYFDKFGNLLSEELKKYQLPKLDIPPLIAAKRPDEAVIYGCYELARQKQ